MSKLWMKISLCIIYLPLVMIFSSIIVIARFGKLDLSLWCACIACLNLIVCVITSVCFALTAGRRFEKLFQNVVPQVDYLYLTMGKKSARIADYLMLIDDYDFQKSHNTRLYRLYNGYDFPANVSYFEFFLAKLFNFSVWCSIIFVGGFSILLWFPWEQQQVGLAHEILYLLVLTILLTGIISLTPYFYLKRTVFPRFQKLMVEKQWPGHSTKIFYWDCLRLLNNYASNVRRKTSSYCRLKITDFPAHVTRWECFLGKVVCWVGCLFALSILAIIILLFVRIGIYFHLNPG